MADHPDYHDNIGYVPAAHLHERPAALDEIADDDTQPTPLQPIECVLLISEHGAVDDVLFPHAALTPEQLQRWRNRLTAIRFSPGRLYGRAVRAALRLELRIP